LGCTNSTGERILNGLEAVYLGDVYVEEERITVEFLFFFFLQLVLFFLFCFLFYFLFFLFILFLLLFLLLLVFFFILLLRLRLYIYIYAYDILLHSSIFLQASLVPFHCRNIIHPGMLDVFQCYRRIQPYFVWR